MGCNYVVNNNIASAEWYNHFKKLLNKVPNVDQAQLLQVNQYLSDHDDICDECYGDKPDILNCPMTEEEVIDAVCKSPCGKAPGYDGIPNEMLKAGLPVLASHMTILFNHILAKGDFP
jgi:hypothetical protein